MEARYSVPVQTGRGTHPGSYTMGTGFFFPGVKRPECGVDQPLPSSAEFNERVELYLYSRPPPGFVACSRVTFTFTFTVVICWIKYSLKQAGIAQSLWRLATGWPFRDWVPCRRKRLYYRQTARNGCGTHPATYSMGVGILFRGG